MNKRLTHIALIAGAVLLGAQTQGPRTFSSPEEARDAMLQAAATGLDAVMAIFGPGSAAILRTGDTVQDQKLLKDFNRRAAERVKLEPDEMNPDRVTLLVGADEWPFAVPLVRRNGRWYFDVQEGKLELRRRVIGGNELDAIQVCQGYLEAQQIYAATDWSGSGVLQYARRIVSSPGRKDGLYWPGDDSPVARGFARAVREGYVPSESPALPYHGYFYKQLFKQGPDADTGAEDYIVHDLMIGGFALVAWPAEYSVSGIMTFIVNQDGFVFQKDLGPQTATLARAMTTFNPDKSWTRLVQLP